METLTDQESAAILGLFLNNVIQGGEIESLP
jgi:hypothetical protein